MSGFQGRFVDLGDLYKRDILTPEELAAVDRPSALYEKASRVFDEERKKAVEWVGQQCLQDQLMLLECSTKVFSICHDQRDALHECQNRAMVSSPACVLLTCYLAALLPCCLVTLLSLSLSIYIYIYIYLLLLLLLLPTHTQSVPDIARTSSEQRKRSGGKQHWPRESMM
jgi:hypothetical protein